MMLRRRKTGGVAEWLKAPVLKTGIPKGNVGSNPTPSAMDSSKTDTDLSPLNRSCDLFGAVSR